MRRGRHLIFDLDRTLWRCTVEYHPRLRLPRPFPGTEAYLERCVARGDTLYVASRSASPRCREFLARLFPRVPFHGVAVWPSVVESKRAHVESLLEDVTRPFVFFDDELVILQDLARHFPRVECRWRDPSKGWEDLV